jgi:hypothetical protein
MDSFGGVSGGGRTLYGDNPRGSGPDRRRGTRGDLRFFY